MLSGTKEAELAALGVIAGIHAADGFVGDLGGGSLELIDVRGGRLADAATLPLGGLRLIDASGGSLKKAREIVDAELAKVDWLEKGRDRDFYAIGGTWRALARLHMTQTNYPLSVMHNYRIEADDALQFAALLDQQSQSSLAGIRDISSARRETIPYGALVLERLIRQVKPRAVVISVFGIREGLLYTLLSDEEKRKDPLLAACDDLARQAVALGRQRLRALLLDRRPVPGAGPDRDAGAEAAAACGLPLVGYRLARASGLSRRAEPQPRRARQFRRRRSSGPRLPGAHRLLPQRRTIKDELSQRLIELVDKDMLKRARILGAAFRAAHMVSAAMPGVLTNTPITYEGNRLVWTLPEPYSNLEGERVDRGSRSLPACSTARPRSASARPSSSRRAECRRGNKQTRHGRACPGHPRP